MTVLRRPVGWCWMASRGADKRGGQRAVAGSRSSSARPFAFTVLTLLAILVGGVAELAHHPGEAGGARDRQRAEAVHRARAAGPRPLRRARAATSATRRWCGRWSPIPRATARRRAPRSSSTTTRSSGARKRTGPDLHRVGGRYPNLWHYTHLMDPRVDQPGLEHADLRVAGQEGRIDAKLAPQEAGPDAEARRAVHQRGDRRRRDRPARARREAMVDRPRDARGHGGRGTPRWWR